MPKGPRGVKPADTRPKSPVCIDVAKDGVIRVDGEAVDFKNLDAKLIAAGRKRIDAQRS